MLSQEREDELYIKAETLGVGLRMDIADLIIKEMKLAHITDADEQDIFSDFVWEHIW